MTITTETTRAELNGNGTAGPFQCGFRILNDSDLKVLVGGVLKTLTTHYTVANAGTETNATVTFTSGNFPANNISVVLSRDLPNTQPTNYQNNTALDAETLEASFDRAVMQTQQIVTSTDRAIKFADDVLGVDSDATEVSTGGTDRANKILGFDANGDISATVELGTNRGDWAASTAFVVRDIVRDASNNNVYICITAHTSQGTTPISSNADVAKWQLIINASAVQTSATNASTSETNAANSATAAATSETNAATSETNAGTSATNAATSATNASTSESNAASSATQAAASAANAATSYDSFDDRYLGTKSSAPSTDNDGNALVTGALYFDTTDSEMKVYDGSAWIAASAAQNVTILEYVYSITGNTTSITGSDDNSATLSFGSTESVNVYLNGVQLLEGASQDYTLSASTNTVTLASNAVNGDVVKVVVYKTFTVGDAVPASTGGTFSGNVTAPNLIIGDGGNIGSASDTDALTINSSGNVGINEANPSDAKLKITNSTASLHSFKVEQSGSGGYWASYINNTNTDDSYGLKVQAGNDANDRNSDFAKRDGTYIFQILGDGDVKVNTGNLVIGTAGKGIDFSAQTATSATGATTTAELLDHYEEGTWTPTVAGGTAVFGSVSGSYIKIGSQVTVYMSLTFTSGNTLNDIGGLPFPVSTSNGGNFVGGARENSVNGAFWQLFSNSNGSSNITIRQYDNSNVITSSYTFLGTFTYET